MTHNKFTTFALSNNQVFGGNVDEFLNSGKDIRSMSICELKSSNSALVTLGYNDEAPVSHKYHLTTKSIGPANMNVDEISAAIEAEADGLNGIICQDLTEVAGELIVSFLAVIA